MDKVRSKVTSQGQVSVPAAVRSFLHLRPGSVLVWSQEGDRVVVQRETRHGTEEVHRALFEAGELAGRPPAKLEEMKQGVRDRMRRSHAGR